MRVIIIIILSVFLSAFTGLSESGFKDYSLADEGSPQAVAGLNSHVDGVLRAVDAVCHYFKFPVMTMMNS